MTRSFLSVIAVAATSLVVLTGCSTLTASEVQEITPAMVRYPGPNPGFLDPDAQWAFVNSDHQLVELDCPDVGLFETLVCSNPDGTVQWEPKKTKSTRYGFLTVDGGERVRFKCTQRFEGFEEVEPTRFCYKR